LSNELKLAVYALLKRPAVARDFEFCAQLRSAASSAPANIAEGFGRYRPREMAQYLRVANGSLMETASRIRDGADRGHFTPADIAPLLKLARRASATTTRLARYLDPPRRPRSSQRTVNPEP